MPDPITDLVLYGTSACHLCEQAADLLRSINLHCIRWLEVDIAEDEALLQQYALSIPVLKRMDTQQTLSWPFTQQAIVELLQLEP